MNQQKADHLCGCTVARSVFYNVLVCFANQKLKGNKNADCNIFTGMFFCFSDCFCGNRKRKCSEIITYYQGSNESCMSNSRSGDIYIYFLVCYFHVILLWYCTSFLWKWHTLFSFLFFFSAALKQNLIIVWSKTGKTLNTVFYVGLCCYDWSEENKQPNVSALLWWLHLMILKGEKVEVLFFFYLINHIQLFIHVW